MKKWVNWLVVVLGLVIIGLVVAVELVKFTPVETHELGNQLEEEGGEWVDFSASEIDYGLLEAGNSYTQSLVLTNKSDEAVELELAMRQPDWSGVTLDDQYKEIVEWLRFTGETELKLAAGESANVGVRVRVPTDAKAGSQYAILWVKDKTMGADDLGVPVGVSATVNGDDLRVGGELRENSVAMLSMFGGLDAMVRVESMGNMEVPISYETVVRPLFGGDVLYESKGETVAAPGMLQEIDNNWREAPVAGIYNVTQKVTYVNMNGEQVESAVSRVAIVCPFWIIVTVGVVILAEVAYFVIRAIWQRKHAGKKKSSDQLVIEE